MSYSFSTKGINANNVNAPMKPGEKVDAVFAKAEVTPEGHIDFFFKNDTGSLKHREFCIDPSHPKFDADNANLSMEKITHICAALVDKTKLDAINGDGVPFATWAGQVAALLTANAANKPVVIHVIVRDGKFVSFPRYRNFISSDLNECGWTTNPDYHKYEFVKATPDAEGDARDGIIDENGDEEEESF